MKLTTDTLREIIKEELENVVNVQEEPTLKKDPALRDLMQKTLDRITDLEDKIAYLMSYYRDTSGEDVSQKTDRLSKTKSKDAIRFRDLK